MKLPVGLSARVAPRRRGCLAVLACGLVIAGCSGGGSDNGSEDKPIGPRYSEDAAATLARDALEHSGRVLDFAQFATDIVHRFVEAGSPAAVSAKCAYAGSVALRFDDRDSNGRASAGDSLTAVLSGCGLPLMQRALTGSLRVDLLPGTGEPETHLEARVTLLDEGVQVESWKGSNVGEVIPGKLAGSFDVRWTESADAARLDALSSVADDLRFATVRDGRAWTDRLRQLEISQTARYELASNVASVAFTLDYGSVGMDFRITSPVPLKGGLHVPPREMRIQMQLPSGQHIRIERQTILSTVPQVSARLVEASGQVSFELVQSWRPLTSLVRDARRASFVPTFTDVPSSVVLMPWRGALAGEIDRACEQQPVAGVSTFRADALFQRPVKPQPALSDDGARVHLQFSEPLAETMPSLHFRFSDMEGPGRPEEPNWPVATDAVRRGALYEIRLAEPLRQQRDYVLAASSNSSSWDKDLTVQFASGTVQAYPFGWVSNAYEQGSVSAFAGMADVATIAPGAPARLNSVVRLLGSASAVRYQWRQLSGPALRLTTPDAASTEAVLDGTAAVPVAKAVVQLDVTDNLGSSDRFRLVLNVGNRVEQGAALYTERAYTGFGGHRSMDVGPGSFFYGPAPGQVAVRVPALSNGGTGVNFSLRSRDGGPLVPGRYTEFGDEPVVGGMAMGIVNYCFEDAVVGSFDLLEFQYAADGAITRLAVDFEQRCGSGSGESTRGSYRYNSSLLLRP